MGTVDFQHHILEVGRGLRGALWELLFPARCVGCGGRGALICGACFASFVPRQPPWCARCGQSLAGDEELCSRCRQEPPPLQGVRSLYNFTGPLQRTIHALKYRGLKALAGPLAQPMAEELARNPATVDLLVPVPLHPATQRQRGYNQSALLAREIQRKTGMAVAETGLRRLRRTLPQTRTSSAAERRSNVAGAFAGDPSILGGKRILLVDDVCTTGATLAACAEAAREAGAAAIWGLTLGRES